MQYFGGKFRIRKQVAELINSYNPVLYLEPFCGSAWVAELVKSQLRVCCDLHPDLIAMWNSLQHGWKPPSTITQDQYHATRLLESPDPLKAFVGFGCSFAGRYFEGYARTAKKDNSKSYAAAAKRQLEKRIVSLEDVIFQQCDYEQAITLFDPDVLYCDPPYKGTKFFSGLPRFDNARFWDVMYEESFKRVVLVSEFEAPPEFEAVLCIETNSGIRNGDGNVVPRVEKVFKLKT